MPPPRPALRRGWGVRGKLSLAGGVLVLAVAAVATLGVNSLSSTNAQTRRIYVDNLTSIGRTADLTTALDDVELASLRQLSAVTPARRDELDVELDGVLLPQLTRVLADVGRLIGGDKLAGQRLGEIQSGIDEYLVLRRSAAAVAGRVDAAAPGLRADLADRMSAVFSGAAGIADRLRDVETREAAGAKAQADVDYRRTRLLLLIGVCLSLLATLAAGLLLARNLVPRIRRYSQFARLIANGRSTSPLSAAGRDELAELAAALNDMVEERTLQKRQERLEAEFVSTLQVTSSEEEAHELIGRHLERSIEGSTVVVLQRNNSANRLRAATQLRPDSGLTERLVGAEPRACLAVRFARTHREGDGPPPLISCALCSSSGPSTCEPLLVGGEVIGSVLVSHAGPSLPGQDGRIKASVAQAAPVLANLRNLALAEFRANNDSLTGLPNKRATDDTLKRMVAQASRSVTPLAALMLDLDHFKLVNDEFGHSKGDEVLAAVGTAIAASLRASDFAGRFGGEEFLILLPETEIAGAQLVAEKIRSMVGAITVVGFERGITASIGVAGLLEHAGNAAGLMQQADRALYAAKAAGRNRVVVADASDATPREIVAESAPAVRTP